MHRVHAKPVGEPFHETSFVVQRRRDMPTGSPDQLILLDVVFHQHGSTTAPLAESQFDRRVIRVPAAVSRVGLLRLARVSHYCDSKQNCVVLVDHAPWPVQLRADRLLPHGSYARVHVPHRSQLAWRLAGSFHGLKHSATLRHRLLNKSIRPSLPIFIPILVVDPVTLIPL